VNHPRGTNACYAALSTERFLDVYDQFFGTFLGRLRLPVPGQVSDAFGPESNEGRKSDAALGARYAQVVSLPVLVGARVCPGFG
jgi:hypothetical protein